MIQVVFLVPAYFTEIGRTVSRLGTLFLFTGSELSYPELAYYTEIGKTISKDWEYGFHLKDPGCLPGFGHNTEIGKEFSETGNMVLSYGVQVVYQDLAYYTEFENNIPNQEYSFHLLGSWLSTWIRYIL